MFLIELCIEKSTVQTVSNTAHHDMMSNVACRMSSIHSAAEAPAIRRTLVLTALSKLLIDPPVEHRERLEKPPCHRACLRACQMGMDILHRRKTSREGSDQSYPNKADSHAWGRFMLQSFTASCIMLQACVRFIPQHSLSAPRGRDTLRLVTRVTAPQSSTLRYPGSQFPASELGRHYKRACMGVKCIRSCEERVHREQLRGWAIRGEV
jgi:hypothetical protein